MILYIYFFSYSPRTCYLKEEPEPQGRSHKPHQEQTFSKVSLQQYFQGDYRNKWLKKNLHMQLGHTPILGTSSRQPACRRRTCYLNKNCLHSYSSPSQLPMIERLLVAIPVVHRSSIDFHHIARHSDLQTRNLLLLSFELQGLRYFLLLRST